jgi:hypothetical protein
MIATAIEATFAGLCVLLVEQTPGTAATLRAIALEAAVEVTL